MFTGTRAGMTQSQIERVRYFIKLLNPSGAIHGDCMGGDSQFHQLCLLAGVRVTIFPSTLRGTRALCIDAKYVHKPAPPLDRNIHMLRCATEVIAAPRGMVEEIRSGTWHAIRNTRKMGKPVRICYPDGSVEEYHARG